jgi:hypothetical protein
MNSAIAEPAQPRHESAGYHAANQNGVAPESAVYGLSKAERVAARAISREKSVIE